MSKYVILFKIWLVVVDLGPGRVKIITIRQRAFRKTQSTYCHFKRFWHFVFIVCTFIFPATADWTRKFIYIIFGIFWKMLQPRNFSVTRTENRAACIRNFGLSRTLSINNYIRSTISIRNGHIQKELSLIAHVLL